MQLPGFLREKSVSQPGDYVKAKIGDEYMEIRCTDSNRLVSKYSSSKFKLSRTEYSNGSIFETRSYTSNEDWGD